MLPRILLLGFVAGGMLAAGAFLSRPGAAPGRPVSALAKPASNRRSPSAVAVDWTAQPWRETPSTAMRAYFHELAQRDPFELISLAKQRLAAAPGAAGRAAAHEAEAVLAALFAAQGREIARAALRAWEGSPAAAHVGLPALTPLVADQPVSAAARWLATLPESDARDRLRAELIHRWSLSDRTAALSAAMELPRAEDRFQAAAHGFRTWLEDDPLTALAWLATRENDACFDRLVASAVPGSRLAREQPAVAAEWLYLLAEPDARDAALARLLAVAARPTGP